MAIAFELSVNFDSDEAAATQFCQAIKRNYRTFAIEGYQIDLHEPLVLPFHGLAEQLSYSVSILPKAIGYGVGLDNRQPRIPLNSLQLSITWEKALRFIARHQWLSGRLSWMGH